MEVGGEGDYIYLSLHCHHQNDSCIKMGSDESHFNVSVGSDGQSHRTVSTNHNPFEEKGERYRTEVLRLTNLTPYRQAKLAHSCIDRAMDLYIPWTEPSRSQLILLTENRPRNSPASQIVRCRRRPPFLQRKRADNPANAHLRRGFNTVVMMGF